MKISILGTGSWGSALAIMFSQIADITLWGRNQIIIDEINNQHTNIHNLPVNIYFDHNVIATNDFNNSIINADLIIIATPLNALREILIRIHAIINDSNNLQLLWVCKGFEHNSGLLAHQIMYQIFADSISQYGALLGPSFAHDVACKLPTAISLTSFNSEFALTWAKNFQNIKNFRIYINNDMVGSEIAAGFKNTIAIAAGILDGLHLGHNVKAALITRSLSELNKLIISLGGQTITAYGLTGLGDLILTATSNLSRNYQVGIQLAKKIPLATILTTILHVAEGVSSTREIYRLGIKHKIDMPIVHIVYKIIYENCEIMPLIEQLFNRDVKFEFCQS